MNDHADFMKRYKTHYTVCMVGDNEAIVAETKIILNDDGTESTQCRHLLLSRPFHDGYWRVYNKNTGEWAQLFGLYGRTGNSMMFELPGKHVDREDKLPKESD